MEKEKELCSERLSVEDFEEERKVVLLICTSALFFTCGTVHLFIYLYLDEQWSPKFISSCANIIIFVVILLLIKVMQSFKGACIAYCLYLNFLFTFLGLYHSQVDIWSCFVPLYCFYMFGSKIGLRCFVAVLFESTAVFWIRTMKVLPTPRQDSISNSPFRFLSLLNYNYMCVHHFARRIPQALHLLNIVCCCSFPISLSSASMCNVVQLFCVGFITIVYESSRSHALSRLRLALKEKERINVQLQKATQRKSEFLANISHGLC